MKKSKKYISEGDIPERCPMCDGDLEPNTVNKSNGILYQMICANPNCSYILDIEYESDEDQLKQFNTIQE